MTFLHIAAIDIYVNKIRMISHLIQDLVACFSRKNQRLVLRIFTGNFEWGETDQLASPHLAIIHRCSQSIELLPHR
jgi:hypothetical protein